MYQASAEFIVNTVGTYDQIAPSIAVGLDGTLLVAWQDRRFAYEPGSTLGWDISSQLLTADMAKLGGERIVTHDDLDQTAPKVVTKQDGSFALAFVDDNAPPGFRFPVIGPVLPHIVDGLGVLTLPVSLVNGAPVYGSSWGSLDYFARLINYPNDAQYLIKLSDLDLSATGLPFATWQSTLYRIDLPSIQVVQDATIAVSGTGLGNLAAHYFEGAFPVHNSLLFPITAYSAALVNVPRLPGDLTPAWDGNIATLIEVEDGQTVAHSVYLGIATNAGQTAQLVDSNARAEGAVALSNGNVALLWNHATPTGDTLMARIYSRLGTPVTGALELNRDAGVWDVLDAIPLSTGGFAIAFSSLLPNGSRGSTYVASYDQNGQLAEAPLRLRGTNLSDVSTRSLSLTEGKQGFVYAAYETSYYDGSSVDFDHPNHDIVVVKLGGLVPQPATEVTFANGTHLLALAENTVNGTLVSTLKSVDVNIDDTFTYAFFVDANGVAADAGGAFLLDAAGHLTVKDRLALDFEAPVNGLIVKVIATNQVGQASPVETLTVQLTDEVSETVFGDARDNTIRGNFGNDRLRGDEGKDSLFGGVGHDQLFGDNGADSLVGGDGNDSLEGDAFGGTAANDTMVGGDGNDTLVSLGGADSLDGGAGDDLAVINRASYAAGFVLQLNDLSLTTASDGTKVIGVENFHFTGGIGRDFFVALGGNDTLLGGSGNDQLSGGGGDDSLDGGGGADVLTGGAGNDVFLVDSPLDKVFEGLNEGDDTVKADGNFTLGSGQQIEHLLATGITVDVVLKGNEFGQEILGGIGNDQLTGGGGDDLLDGKGGVDRLFGGTGNDQFHVHSAQDRVFEVAGQGADTILADPSYSLAAGQEVESLEATNVQIGVVLRGNEIANEIIGSNGDDQLSGGAGNDALYGSFGNDQLDGGTGADTMVGGWGNDTYVVEDAGDQVVEFFGEGIDTVKSSVTFTLGPDVEKLVLTGLAAVDGFGGDGGNTITGNGADNLLDGGQGKDALIGGAGNDTLVGGQGNDVLTGGDGADVFRFNSPTDGGDVINDFRPGQDKLEFSYQNGGMASGVFFNGLFQDEDVQMAGHLNFGTAQGFQAQLVYVAQFANLALVGKLYWDANGAAPGQATLLATFAGAAPLLQASDFVVIA